MPFIPAAGVAELAVVSVMANAKAINVFHMDFGTSGPLTPADLVKAANDVGSSFVTNLEVPLSSDVGVLEVRARDLTTQFGAGVVVPWTGNGGTGAATPLPPGSSVVVTWTTGFVGRSFRGRSFLMGLPEGLADEEGRIAGATHTTLVGAAGDFIQDLSPGTLSAAQLSICSKFTANAPRGAALVTPVIDRQVRVHIHSQRRRNLKG